MRSREEIEREAQTLPMQGFSIITELLLDVRDLLLINEQRTQTLVENARKQHSAILTGGVDLRGMNRK
jgi:hypothetical protein